MIFTERIKSRDDEQERIIEGEFLEVMDVLDLLYEQDRLSQGNVGNGTDRRFWDI